MEHLEKCAHCGGKAVFEKQEGLALDSLRIKCTGCGIQTQSEFVMKGNKPKCGEPPVEKMEKVLAKIWNGRIDNG